MVDDGVLARDDLAALIGRHARREPDIVVRDLLTGGFRYGLPQAWELWSPMTRTAD